MFSKAVIGGFLISAALSQGYMAPSEVVPLLGPSFSSNFDPANYDVLRNAPGVLEKKIESLFDRQALDRDGLIFSIDVFSAASNKSVYAYQHVGKSQERALTAPELNQQTSSRIGSVTKLFTVYALLVKAGIEVFDHPVTRYMPELAGNSSESQEDEHIDWEKITIGALASHQAGSGGATGNPIKHMHNRRFHGSPMIQGSWKGVGRARHRRRPKVSKKRMLSTQNPSPDECLT